MKKIAILGKGSYIGNSIKKYLIKTPGTYFVDEFDTYNFSKEKYTFQGYDTVICVAGIAHIKETTKNKHLYYEINRDMAVQIAEKAKEDGVKQFIFLSSMSVYGQTNGIITPETEPMPNTHYGYSKLQAEKRITPLGNENFKIVVMRPPMVYGKGCKGNFQTMIKLIDKLPVFPDIKNRRSMIYIDNLCEFVKMSIEDEREGLYFPQNKEYVQTTKMARIIAAEKKKKIIFSRFLGVLVSIICPFFTIAKKAFGDLVYMDTEKDSYSYCVVEQEKSFRESI